jgi:hypothetical protein
MTPKEEAKWTKDLMTFKCHECDNSTFLAVLAIKEKYNGIVNVIVDLRSRGELGEKVYLKSLDDINNRMNEVLTHLNT